MTCAEANQIALVDYLYSLGIQPHKIRNNDYWYLSRLRDEKTPLFNVNRKLNAWYDWGLGQGGNIIDFALLYHRCTVSELLKKIPEILSFHQPQTTVQQPPPNTQNRKLEALEPTIKVIAAKPLTHPHFAAILVKEKYLSR